jgi:D-alanine-D-alanine ligase
LIEPAIDAREFEVAVLEGHPPIASLPGEICMEGWYDYESKYVNDHAELKVPSEDIAPRMADGLRDLALASFRVLRLSGLARVDFLLDKATGRFALNEVNTLPGFTSISMYPKLMETAGVPFPELCDRLIGLALAKRLGGAAVEVEPREVEKEIGAGR